MRRLIFVRDVYQRIVRDPRLLKSSPVMHDTKFARLAIKLLKDATKDATKDENIDERLQKMEEMAQRVFEGLGDAIEALEKD